MVVLPDERSFQVKQELLRRNLEQAKHCIVEALSVLDHGEDRAMAIEDCEHARDLLVEAVLPKLRIASR